MEEKSKRSPVSGKERRGALIFFLVAGTGETERRQRWTEIKVFSSY